MIRSKITGLGVIVFLVVFSLSVVFGSNVRVSREEVESVLKRSKDWEVRVKGMMEGGNESMKREMKKRAEDLRYYKESEEFKGKVERYKSEVSRVLGKSLGWEIEGGAYRDLMEKKVLEGKGYILGSDERIYVFVSSSMGEVVRRYIIDSQAVVGDVKFVLRGAIGGLTYLRPTVEWILGNVLVDPRCKFEEYCEVYDREFYIDPMLFRRFSVRKVPTVVYVKGDLENPKIVIISSGAVSFLRHLERIFEVKGK